MKDVAGSIAYIALLFAIVGGWIGNIVRLFGGGDSMAVGELIVRVAGIFVFPVGAVMGWIP